MDELFRDHTFIAMRIRVTNLFYQFMSQLEETEESFGNRGVWKKRNPDEILKDFAGFIEEVIDRDPRTTPSQPVLPVEKDRGAETEGSQGLLGGNSTLESHGGDSIRDIPSQPKGDWGEMLR